MKQWMFSMAVLSVLAGSVSGALTECPTLEEAKSVAAAEKRDIMVLYTGTDWCPACIYLEKKILTQPAFEEALGGRIVMVEELFPRTPDARARVKDEEMERRMREMDAYRIASLPCAVLMDAQGYPYALVQGAERSVEGYVRRLEEALAVRARRDAALAAAEGLQGLERARALAAVMEALPEAVQDRYTDVLMEIESLDPENTLGYAGRARRGARQEEMNEAFRVMRRGFAGKIRPEQLDDCRQQVEAFMAAYPDMAPEMLQQCYRLICDGYALRHDYANTYKYAVLAVQAAPETDLARRILIPLTRNLEVHFPEVCREARPDAGQ